MKMPLSRRKLLTASLLLAPVDALIGPRLPGEGPASAQAKSFSIPPGLFDNPAVPVAGNPKGKVTIVEFFDYRCSYCRAMQPLLRDALKQHRQVRLVFKDWPIFGGVSVSAARVALAANWQGKYLPVHNALFKLPLGMTDDNVRAAAQDAGLDMKKLDQDLTGRAAEIDAILARNDKEAQALKLQGTPGFVVGNTLVPGALSKPELETLIARASPANGG